MKDRNPYNQVRRIFSVLKLLAASKCPKTLSQIQQDLADYGVYPDDPGLSPRNLQRDIKFIRNELGYYIVNLPGKGYLFKGAKGALPGFITINPEFNKKEYVKQEA